MQPRHPLSIVSKGRATRQATARALTRIGVPFTVVVEDAEHDDYASALREMGAPAEAVVLPMRYKHEYDLLDDRGLEASTGPGPARNFVWDRAVDAGDEWHWVMDDNVTFFARLHENRLRPVLDGTMFRALEYFAGRYSNVGMAGPTYDFLVPAKSAARQRPAPFIANTRIYSCNLIRCAVPHRWRGRYNEDTILSLDMLKDGWATIQTTAFQQKKAATQTVRGGNTLEFYAGEGTTPKSAMLVRVHPDVSRMIERWGRPHHYVDYRRFKDNPRLRLRDDPEPPPDWGLHLNERPEYRRPTLP